MKNYKFNIDAILVTNEYWDFEVYEKSNMNLHCLNDIVKDCLLINFDIANPKTWNGNSAITISSLSKFCDASVGQFNLCDWGLTQYDVGRTSALTATTNFTYTDTIFDLLSIKYNDASGNTFNINSGITTSSDTGIGSYFSLSGSYFQNFFKLHNYDYELMPYRYNDGFSIETWLKINNNTLSSITKDNDGIFLYLGTRAENKFATLFSGNTGYTISQTGYTYDNNLSAFTITVTATTSTGYTTCSGTTLGPDHINNIELGIDDNILAFKFNSDGTIGYRYVDDKFNVKTCNSPNTITSTGWTYVAITFTPNEKIPNVINLIDCFPARTGTLTIYINGRKFWEIIDFTEFWFKPMDTTADKQIGLPYNISWGGGSYGLKHSYNYNSGNSPYMINPDDQNLLIQDNFDGSFNGGIQILRFHACSLNFSEIKHNFKIDNERYKKNITFGGRIIQL